MHTYTCPIQTSTALLLPAAVVRATEGGRALQGGTTHSISFSAASMARPSRRISRLSGDRRSEPDRTDYHRSDAKTADDVDVDEEDDNDDDDGGSESGNTVILFDPTQAAPGGGSDAPNAV